MRTFTAAGAAALVAAITAGGVAGAVAAGGAGTAAGSPASGSSRAVTSASVSGAAPKVTFQSSASQIETPSGTYQTISRAVFRSPAGPVTVRFSGNAYAMDWAGPDAIFVGRSYAAVLVRVLLDGAPLAPGAVTFGDNTGKVSVNQERPRAASFEWVGQLRPGAHRIDVQFRNRTTWDKGGMTQWSLVVQHP